MGETNHSHPLPQDAQCFEFSEEGGDDSEEGWKREEMPPRKEGGPADGSGGQATSCASLTTVSSSHQGPNKDSRRGLNS